MIITGRKASYPSRQQIEAKFDLVAPILFKYSVRSLLDAGCDAGFITRLSANSGIFSVGIDKVLNISHINEVRCQNLCLGECEINDQLIENIPEFDAIMLLSVAHQLFDSDGKDKNAKKLVFALAQKARSVFVVEFAALNKKYGFRHTTPFIDNDEKSVVAFASDWLKTTLDGWVIEYIGKSSWTKTEPYRFLFTCRPPKASP